MPSADLQGEPHGEVRPRGALANPRCAAHAPAADTANPVVVCAADRRYVMPLAVTLHSAVERLQRGRRLNVFLLDGGIGDEGWMGLRETLAGLPVELTLIQPDAHVLQTLKVSHHITHTAYFRLLAAQLLPPEIPRAIYLDSDLVVLEDLCQLWQMPMAGYWCLAVCDIACPYIDARRGCANWRRATPYMAAVAPVPNWRQLGLDGRAEYFNSGVMLLDLAAWRRENLAERLIRVLRDHQRHVWCWDQYALNVELHQRWRRLPSRWNQGAHAFEYPSLGHSPIGVGELEAMLRRPAIVHFTTEHKPWQFGSEHPLRHLFFQELDRTAWSGWRPSRPPRSWRRSLDRRAVAMQKQLTISYRRLAALAPW